MHRRHSRRVYTAIDSAEIAANHRRIYERNARDYLPESKLYVEAGLFVRASTYIDAQRARAALLRRVLESLEGVDVLAVPTQPMGVPHIGDTVATINGQDEDLTARDDPPPGAVQLHRASGDLSLLRLRQRRQCQSGSRSSGSPMRMPRSSASHMPTRRLRSG